MSIKESIYSAVNQRFAEKRQRNEQITEERKKEAYKKIPGLVKIEEQMREYALDGIKAAINGGGEEAIRRLKKQSLELQAKRAEMLYSEGFLLDYLEKIYDCQKCRDTGYIGSKMCECFKKELKAERYRRSNLGAMLTEQTFKSFDLSFYSDKTNTDYNISPKENMEVILKYTKKYADRFDRQYENLLFTGETGLGKTFLSTAIARTVIDNGGGVIYETASNILNKFQKNQFEHDGDAGEEAEGYFNADLLIIDDLGAEFSTSFSATVLFNLINSRLIAKKPLIISTNLSLSELNDRYDERLISRLSGEFTTLQFFGEDIRGLKLAKRAAKNKSNKT